MLDYKKMQEQLEKKLSDCWSMPYSDENYKKISGYLKDLYHIKGIAGNGKITVKESLTATNPIYSNPDTTGKSEFEKTVIEIYKRNPNEETLLKLLKEFDAVAMILKHMHPARFAEFMTKLKAVNY